MLKPISREEIENRGWGGNGPNRDAIADIKEFLQMDADAALVTNTDHYKNVYSARNAYVQAAKKLGANIKASARKGSLYLIKPRKLVDFLDPDE